MSTYVIPINQMDWYFQLLQFFSLAGEVKFLPLSSNSKDNDFTGGKMVELWIRLLSVSTPYSG